MVTTSGLASTLKLEHPDRQLRIQKSIAAGNEIFEISIPSSHIIDQDDSSVVVYEVDVSNRKLRWNLWLRFEAFYLFSKSMADIAESFMTSDYGDVKLPPFPERRPKMFVDHFDPNFVEHRRVLLENYMRTLLRTPMLRNAEVFTTFLVPDDQTQLFPMLDSSVTFKLLTSSPDNPDDDTPGSPSVGLERDPEEITSVSIPSAQILKHDHTIYQVHVCNSHKRKSFAEWTLLKRYSEFAEFHRKLEDSLACDQNTLKRLPSLPPKHFVVFTDHLDRTFIERRRILLQNYLRRLVALPQLRHDPTLLQFLGVS